MNHLGIKNLSIALEALSRINSYEAHTASKAIHDLLGKEIEEAEKQQQFAEEAQKRPTPTVNIANPDDDIPF